MVIIYKFDHFFECINLKNEYIKIRHELAYIFVKVSADSYNDLGC